MEHSSRFVEFVYVVLSIYKFVCLGYSQAFIYNVEDARVLLNKLAEQTDDGVAFRRHLFYIGSTFIGDNTTYVNGVGAVGEITFTPEANLGNFSCNGTNERPCELLNVAFSSSSTVCLAIDAAYQTCTRQYVFNDVRCKLLLCSRCLC